MEENKIQLKVQEALLRGLENQGLITKEEMWIAIEYLYERNISSSKNKKFIN